MANLDKSWRNYAARKACRAFPDSNYLDGVLAFQEIAIKELENRKLQSTEPDFIYGIEQAIEILSTLKPNNKKARFRKPGLV